MRVIFTIFLFTSVCAARSVGDVRFNVDPATTQPFSHYWERCVGSCHATMALRADWRAHLTRAHADLGFQMVRFHGLLMDDMSVFLGWRDGKPIISLYNIFEAFDFLLSIGMRPFVEVSFMPELLASGKETIFHYKGNITPPKDPAQWAQLIAEIVRGLIARYGLSEVRNWPFEIWNEPNCDFFSGTQAEFFALMNTTYWAIKGVDSRLLVGGPTTCQSAWIPETLAFARSAGISLDFISTHEYPTDLGVDKVTRDIMPRIIAQTRKQAGGLPLYYTEYNDGLYYGPSHHDEPYAAAFIAQNIVDIHGLVDVLSWWTFTDLFEEGGLSSQPFFKDDGWGLLSLQGIPKPSYRAFQLLHEMGTTRVEISGTHPTVGLLGTFSTDGRALQLLAWNHDVINSSRIRDEELCVVLSGLRGRLDERRSVTIRRIDSEHANAPRYWREVMHSPAYPTKAQIDLLEKQSQLVLEPLGWTPVGTSDVQLCFELPAEGVASIAVPLRA